MTIALYITGGGKHVHKPAEGSSARKSFALLGKLAHCWTGPYKVLWAVIIEELNFLNWEFCEFCIKIRRRSVTICEF